VARQQNTTATIARHIATATRSFFVFHVMPLLPWQVDCFFAPEHCHHQVDFICCFLGKVTDATATMAICKASFFHGTPLIPLLVDCSYFCTWKHLGCGGPVDCLLFLW